MDNPYASPQTPADELAQDSDPVAVVNMAVWTLIVWLTPAAFIHAFWFCGWAMRGLQRVSLRSVVLESLALAAAGVIVAWFVTSPLLMAASEYIRRIIAPRTSSRDWQRELANSMPTATRKAPWLMVGWMIGIAEMAANRFAIVGPVICHLLAAWWYVPLFASWWRLRQTQPQEAH